jgi:hypothetical protein
MLAEAASRDMDCGAGRSAVWQLCRDPVPNNSPLTHMLRCFPCRKREKLH